ncbi:ArsR/SmtB family transcription factor [Chelativorans sp. YIM 93263]|uniref:ArsR/SmtB family transcription factor n=1 Tax=Chelativorans sp. YIM 93263 TaxID=2906648 RepID=UPI002378AAE4|nr:helix-turn-helix transcriptional regulator [Chelativorans sp. YIM 93263]
MVLHHPPAEDINLASVLAVLGDPTRLAILRELARKEGQPLPCSHFANTTTSKSNLTYHLSKMREAGIVHVEPRGTSRLVSLRRADVDARFPGLLDSILATLVQSPSAKPLFRGEPAKV